MPEPYRTCAKCCLRQAVIWSPIATALFRYWRKALPLKCCASEWPSGTAYDSRRGSVGMLRGALGSRSSLRRSVRSARRCCGRKHRHALELRACNSARCCAPVAARRQERSAGHRPLFASAHYTSRDRASAWRSICWQTPMDLVGDLLPEFARPLPRSVTTAQMVHNSSTGRALDDQPQPLPEQP
jgi:hypothetical protein